MATNKVSSKNFELIKEEMIRQGIDVSNFKTDILVEDQGNINLGPRQNNI